MNRQMARNAGSSEYRLCVFCDGIVASSSYVMHVDVMDANVFVLLRQIKHFAKAKMLHEEMVRLFGKIFDYANWHLYVVGCRTAGEIT